MATGTATLAFGAQPGGPYASVDVTGQSGLTSASFIEAFFMGSDTTASNSADDHKLAAAVILLSCAYLSATSFRIHALCHEGGWAWGDYSVRWVTA